MWVWVSAGNILDKLILPFKINQLIKQKPIKEKKVCKDRIDWRGSDWWGKQSRGCSHGCETPAVFVMQNSETLQILLFAFIRKQHGSSMADHGPCCGHQWIQAVQSPNPVLLETGAARWKGCSSSTGRQRHSIKQSGFFSTTWLTSVFLLHLCHAALKMCLVQVC